MDYMNNIFLLERPLTKHKALEIQVSTFRSVNSYFDFQLKWDRSGDHAGLVVHFEVWRLMCMASVYDMRHWNYREDRFYEFGESESNGPATDLGQGVKLTLDDMANLMELLAQTPDDLKRIDEMSKYCHNKIGK